MLHHVHTVSVAILSHMRCQPLSKFWTASVHHHLPPPCASSSGAALHGYGNLHGTQYPASYGKGYTAGTNYVTMRGMLHNILECAYSAESFCQKNPNIEKKP
jgi:hypothetical protein